jgi:hypothetical protein
MSAMTEACFRGSASAEGGPQHSEYKTKIGLSTPGKRIIELDARSSVSSQDDYIHTALCESPQRYDVNPPQAVFAPAAPTREAFDASPSYPVMITENPVAGPQVCTLPYKICRGLQS